MKYSFEGVLAAVEDSSMDAGISIHSELEPLGGPGAPVKPAVYAGGLYQRDRRWWRDGDEPVEAIVIDNAPAQANRMERALSVHRRLLGLPMMNIDFSAIGELPPHVAQHLTSFDLPHRHADAYLRDSVVVDTGEPFLSSEIGAALVAASAVAPDALLEWFPQSLIFGFWQSHLGKKGAQTKFARAVDSEIVGYRPASTDTRRMGLKGDPLNLSLDDAIAFNVDDQSDWDLLEGAKSGGKKAKESLAEIGHGQVPVGSDGPLAGISFQGIEQSLTVSFARLRNIETGNPDRNAAARAVLAALAIVAAEAAFSGSFTLRSGCDLRPVSRQTTWRGVGGDEELESIGMDRAVDVLASAADHGFKLGLPVGKGWRDDPVQLVPNAALGKVVAKTFGLERE